MMKITQVKSIVVARWKLACTTAGLVLAIAGAITFALPEKYTAYAAVVINSKGADPISGLQFQSNILPSYIATQIDIMQSERVARRVVRQTNLAANPTLRNLWLDETGGSGDYESWLAQLISKPMEVEPSRDSGVIQVKYSAQDASFAAAMANAFVKAYMETALELRVEPAKRYTELFEEQAKLLRSKLEEARAKLSDYQKAKGIIATDERLDVENARLADLSNQLVALQSVSADSRGRQRSAGPDSPEVLNNPVVAALKADVSRQEARLKELSASLGEAHPQVTQLKASNQELRARIESEIRRVTNSVAITNTVNKSREAEVSAALQAQRQRVLELKAKRDEASVLLGDVDQIQRAYDALQVRFAQTSLESQSNQTDASVLKEATPPSTPSFPKPVLTLVSASVLGILLGVGVAVVRELFNRKIRSEEDVEEFSQGLVLGVMPAASEVKLTETALMVSAPKLSTQSRLLKLASPKAKDE